MRRRTAIVVGLTVFLAVSALLARFLAVEGRERDAIVELLEQRERAGIDIVRIDSETAYSLGDAEGWSRVVWTRDPAAEPTVQCVRVRRDGNPLTGTSVTLLRVQPPLRDNEAGC